MRRGILAALTVVVVLGALLAYVNRPTPRNYESTAAQAATGGLAAVRTVRLAGFASLDGRTLDPYLSVVLGESADQVAFAQRRLSEQQPPDDASRHLRDQLAPLLAAAARLVGDAALAADKGDDTALRRAIEALGPVGDRLDDFAGAHR